MCVPAAEPINTQRAWLDSPHQRRLASESEWKQSDRIAADNKKKFTVSTSVQTMKLSLTDETRIFFSEFLGHFFSQPPVETHPNGMSLSLSLCFPAILVFFVFICPPSGPMRTQKKSKSLNNKMRLRQKRWNQSSGSRWKPSDGERAQKTPRIKAKRRN